MLLGRAQAMWLSSAHPSPGKVMNSERRAGAEECDVGANSEMFGDKFGVIRWMRRCKHASQDPTTRRVTVECRMVSISITVVECGA